MNVELILQDLINEYFPELKGKPIKIIHRNIKGTFMGVFGLPFLGYIIFINKSCRKLNKDQLIGVLAHELVHISRDYKDGFFSTIWNTLKRSNKIETQEERMTDLEVIHRGLGKELLEFIKYHDKHYKKYTSKDGLTKKEIKNYLNQNKS